MNHKHQKIVQLYRKGKSMREVASVVGVSVNTVQRVLKKYEVPSRPQGRGISVEQKEQVMSMYQSGMTPTDIFRSTKVSYKTILTLTKE